MSTVIIEAISTRDLRFKLKAGEGTDSIHKTEEYAFAVALLRATETPTGSGLAFTLGGGNHLVCQAIEALGASLIGRDIEEVMGDYGRIFHELADHPQYRWLGPHKGVVHLALSAITNACFDLWAKSRGLPLWRLLLDLTPEELVRTLDLSYLEDALGADEAIEMLASQMDSRPERSDVLEQGYPGYDTSVGWYEFSTGEVMEKARAAVGEGFGAVKLKVGGADSRRDIDRALKLRETVGPDIRIMLDANQQWSLPRAVRLCGELAPMDPYWIEEPTHPDDVIAHHELARAIAPMKIAAGEAVPNRVVFKNLMQAEAVHFVQVDVTRVGGVSEFISISLLARKFGLPVVPHVGDMGQIHQHLVLFNRVAIGHDEAFLEYIPHLREHMLEPARVEGGHYQVPTAPGSSSDLR